MSTASTRSREIVVSDGGRTVKYASHDESICTFAVRKGEIVEFDDGLKTLDQRRLDTALPEMVADVILTSKMAGMTIEEFMQRLEVVCVELVNNPRGNIDLYRALAEK